MKRQVSKIVMVLGLCAGLGLVLVDHAPGAVPREDLSACELPHGTVELGEDGSPAALRGGGHIFNFEKGKLVPDPWDLANERTSSAEVYLERIRREKTGDISYSSLGEGSLMAMSGRMRDLGKHFLYEFDGKKLKRPAKVWSTPEPGDMEPPTSGVIQKTEEGRCYLVETVTGKFALIRLIEERSRSAVIDWVYQPNGKRVFQVPKGELIEPPAERSPGLVEKQRVPKVVPVPRIAVINEARAEEAAAMHLANRKVLTESLINIVRDPNETTWARAVSVRTLGQIRVLEAAPLLASMIDARLPTAQLVLEADINVIFGCMAALVNIGKPGAVACLEEITKLTPEDRKRPFKEKLLCLVIVRVEGVKIARILLEDRKQTAKNTQEIENLQRAINLIDEVKSWR